MAQVEVAVCHHALDLVELSQVGGVQRLIAEHTVNGEVLGRCKAILGKFVQHACADGRCVCAHYVALSFLQLPVVLVPRERRRGRSGVREEGVGSGRKGRGQGGRGGVREEGAGSGRKERGQGGRGGVREEGAGSGRKGRGHR